LKAQGREGNPLTRNLNDAAALAEKVARKKREQEEEAARAATATTTKVEQKKKPETPKDRGLDDLLNVGLSGVKKK
jgi:hypothetical protein